MRRVLLAFCGIIGPLAAAPSYYRDIQSILQKQCQGCHQPASKASDLDVTTFEAFVRGGKRGPGFLSGKPDESTTIRYLTGAMKPRMPLAQPALAEADITLFRDWIAAGAKNDSPVDVTESSAPLYLQPPVITALRFSPDGLTIAVSGNREILLHKADGSKLLHRLPGRAERILSVSFSADGKLLIAGGGTPAQFGEVQVWDVPSAKLLRSALLTNDTVFGASLAPD